MNKPEIIDAVASALGGVSKAEAEKALNAVLTTITTIVASGDDARLAGFGIFSRKIRPERNGRNPATKEPMVIKAKKSVKFKPAKDFEARV